MKSAIGEHIKVLRRKRGWTQTELSLRTGIDRPVISDYERGKRKPKIEPLSALATAFNVSVAVLDNSLMNPMSDLPAPSKGIDFDLYRLAIKKMSTLNEEHFEEVWNLIRNLVKIEQKEEERKKPSEEERRKLENTA